MFKYAFLEIEISGKDIDRFLNLCVFHDIILENIEIKGEKYYFQLDAKDLFSLQTIVRKTGVKLKIIKKMGLYYFFKDFFSRKVFLLFLCVGIVFLFFFSQLLWEIEILGNMKISGHLIEEFLETEGIFHGMPLKEIRAEELEKKLRKEFSDITWVSVSINGTSLKVHIKENDTMENVKEGVNAGNIVADKAGTVESILVRQGTKAVSVGDKVEKGTVLIEGIREVPDEQDAEIKRIPVAAKGDVAVVYEIPVNEKILLEYHTKVYSGKELKKYQLYTKESIYNLNDDNIPFLQYDNYEEEITPFLLKIVFPNLKLVEINYRDYLLHKEKYNLKEAEEILTKNFNKILESLKEKGVQIIEKNVKIKTDHVSVTLEGELKVREVFKENDYRNE